MKKIILFYFIFYLLVNKTYALPLLGVVPVVFDFSILIIVFFIGFLSTLLFYFIKKIKILIYLLSILFIILNIYLINIIGISGFLDINLDIFGFNLKYLFIVIIVFPEIVFIFFMLKKKYIVLFLLLLIIPININLINDTLDLKNRYEFIISSLNKRVNNTIKFDSHLVLNNIIASRDINYIYQGKKHICRFSISYYLHTGSMKDKIEKDVLKEKKINLYVGFYDQFEERKLCKNLIEKDFKF
ncbi:hypothetical protein EOM39_00085 [Candidatus Gracilibacteria bacterium]|nr:hypothetical protein [Candidatus Gracilibacteria bacterium]